MAASAYKWLFLSMLSGLSFMEGNLQQPGSRSPRRATEQSEGWERSSGGLHPIHISVIEINHNASDKTLEIMCKIFTDDFERTLAKKYNAKVDLINPPDKAAMDSLVKKYLNSHLHIKANGRPVSFSYLGFEHEVEAVYSYIEVLNVPSVNRFDVTTDIMYDTFDDQMNILHVIVNGNRKSTRLNYPNKEAALSF